MAQTIQAKGLENFLSEYSKELRNRGLTHDHLQVKVDISEVKDIHPFFNPSDWYIVGRYLNLQDWTLEPLKVEVSKESERLFKALDSWLKEDDGTTYINLLLSLFRSDKKLFNSTIHRILDFLADKFETGRPKQSVSESNEEPERESLESDTSEYQSQHSSPEFVCVCGACTLKDYLLKGCPMAGKLKNYPKIDIKGLSLEEQEMLLVRLDRETAAVQRKFGSLTLAIARSLSSSQLSQVAAVKEISLFLDSFTTFTATTRNDDKFLSDAMAEINSAESIVDLFNILKPYWSWINYELLEEIVAEFCDKSIKTRLEAYKEQSLTPFLKRSVIEIPSNAYGHSDIPNYKKLIFKLGTDMESHSASSLPLIRDKLAFTLGVDHKAMHIATVKDGCMEVTFLVPEAVLKVVFPLSKIYRSCLLDSRSTAKAFESSHSGNLYKTEEIPLAAIPEDVPFISYQSSSSYEEEVPPFPLKQHSTTLQRQNTHPFTRQDSSASDDDCSVQTKPAPSVSMIGSSGYHTLSEKPDASTDAASNTANMSSVSPVLGRKTYLGVSSVCKTCLLKHYNDKMFHELQCFQSDHDHTPYIPVAWDKSKLQWIEVRKPPDHMPKGRYSMCFRDERCHGENCTFAHNEVELDAWNFELKKRRDSGDSGSLDKLVFLPGKKSEVPPRNWKTNFFNRRKKSNLQKARISLPLTKDNYKQKFYHLLCFEEMEHISKLTKKCDLLFKLHIFRKNPEFLFMDFERPQEGVVYGFLSGPNLTSNELEYATQASEALFFVKFSDANKNKSSKEDICEVKIHSHNFISTEEKLYVYFPSSELQKIKENYAESQESTYLVNVEFEVKHFYFNTLHQAVVKLPDSMAAKLLPNPTRKDFPVFKIEQFAWPPLDLESFSFLHLNFDSQLPALQRIVSCSSTVPFILSGPFGSGKTRVLACAAFYFVFEKHSSEPARILICAHHQQSTETFIHAYFGNLMKKCSSVKLQVVHIVRGKHEKRGKFSEFYKTIPEFKRWCESGEYNASRPIIVISTYMNSLSLYEILQVPGYGFFTHFLLDEAAQVREPEAIAPLSMGTQNAKIVLAGDYFQVGPNILVFGPEAVDNGLNVSLLERLLKMYKCNGAVSSQYFTELNVIYRCHQSLLHLPGKLFYNGSLEPGKRHVKVHLGPNGYKFVCSESVPLPQKSLIQNNESEAILLLEEVLSHAETMKKEDTRFHPREICIISSSRNQLNAIKMLVHNDGRYTPIRGVKFLPSFILQGYEFKAIFLSLFGSLSDGEMYHTTKSLCNPIVFNTVITRAMTRVVAVGNPYELLRYESNSSDPVKPWNQYLKLCIAQDSVVSMAQHDEKLKISKMLLT